MMKKELLRKEFERLLYPESLEEALESYKLVTDVAFEIVSKQKGKLYKSVEYLDAEYLFQMASLKNLSLLKLAESLSYHNDIGNFDVLNIYDPFTLNSIIRTQYEAFCNFNNIYRLSIIEDEMKFKYNLWVICGLKYRQGFPAEQIHNIQKKEAERQEIIGLNSTIENSIIFSNLDPKSKKNVKDAIKKKNWQIFLDNNRAYTLPWHEMFKNAGVNQLLDGQYSFLSLNTHPSNVSIIQYKEMYACKRELESTILAIKLSKWLISFLISDLCYCFSSAKETFDTLPVMNQILVNSYNGMFRSEKYKINNAASVLN